MLLGFYGETPETVCRLLRDARDSNTFNGNRQNVEGFMGIARTLFIITCLTLLGGTIFAQKPWERDKRVWSREDALSILTDSPFARTFAPYETEPMQERPSQASAKTATDARSGVQPTMKIVTRLHSSKIVREALAVLARTNADYALLGQIERRALDDRLEADAVNRIYEKYHVISVGKFFDGAPALGEEGIFQRTTFTEVKGNVWLLTDSGQRLDVFQFIPAKSPTEPAFFYFRRFDDSGIPFLKPGTRTFKMVFGGGLLSPKNSYSQLIPKNAEFRTLEITNSDGIMF